MGYSVKKMNLKNFIGFKNITVNFDKNITYLVGPNGAGKSSIGLNGLWFIFKGIAEKGKDVLIGERFRFIGEEGQSAKGLVTIVDEKTGVEIVIKRTVTKSSNKLEFIAPDGYVLDQEWLDNLFNLHMIAPWRFVALTSKEQAIALGINTDSFAKELQVLKEKYTEINAVYRNIVPGEKPIVSEDAEDVDILKSQIKMLNEAITPKAVSLATANGHIKEMDRIMKEMERLQIMFDQEEILLSKLVPQADTPIEGAALLSADLDSDKQKLLSLETRLQVANHFVEQQNDLKRWKEAISRKEDQAILLEKNKEAQKDVENRKIEYLKSKKLPFKNLSINDEGELLMNDRPLKEQYFSTGQLLSIVPRLLATTNPELKYVFVQQFDLLDEDRQKTLIEELQKMGLQLVIEKVAKTMDGNENIIILNEMEITNQEPEEDNEVIKETDTEDQGEELLV